MGKQVYQGRLTKYWEEECVKEKTREKKVDINYEGFISLLETVAKIKKKQRMYLNIE